MFHAPLVVRRFRSEFGLRIDTGLALLCEPFTMASCCRVSVRCRPRFPVVFCGVGQYRGNVLGGRDCRGRMRECAESYGK